MKRRPKTAKRTVRPRASRAVVASTRDCWPGGVPVACRTTIADVFGGVVNAVGLLILLFASLSCPAMATIRPHTLQVKTCNSTKAGTVGKVLLSFCDGESSCEMGPPNVYNARGELKTVGTWNTLKFPLEYEPTTMLMTIWGTDAWCVEALVWDNGENLLGRGGKLFLDGNLGETGCEYGVNIRMGWFYPCQSSWRFFNLPGSDDYTYEVATKACSDSSTTTSESVQLSSTPSAPRIIASLCSESQCNGTVGDVVDFNLSEAATSSDSGWATTLVPAGFNPVAMRLINVGDVPWCAEQISFNEYALLSRNVSSRGLQLAVGDDRSFFNVQALGTAARTFGEDVHDEEEGDAWGHILLEHALQVLSAVVLFAITGVGAHLFRRCVPSSPNGRKHKNSANNRVGDEGGDGHDEADNVPLCKACGQVSDHPREIGQGKESPRHATVGTPQRVLWRDDSGRMLLSDDGEQSRSDCGETRDTLLRLWGVGSRRILPRLGLRRNTVAPSSTVGKDGFRDRVPSFDGRAETDSTATLVTITTTNANTDSNNNAPRWASAREMSAETFMEGFDHVQNINAKSHFEIIAPASFWDKRGFKIFKGGRGHNEATLSEGKGTIGDGVGSGKSRGRTTSNEGEARGTKDTRSVARGASTSPPSSQRHRPAPLSFQALGETSGGSSKAFPSSKHPLPV